MVLYSENTQLHEQMVNLQHELSTNHIDYDVKWIWVMILEPSEQWEGETEGIVVEREGWVWDKVIRFTVLAIEGSKGSLFLGRGNQDFKENS